LSKLLGLILTFAFVNRSNPTDQFHPESEQIFRVSGRMSISLVNGAWTGGAVSPMLRKEFQIELSKVVMVVPSNCPIFNSPDGIAPDEVFQ